MNLGQNIAQLRRQAGLSQEQLAEQVGVSRQAVSKWESGQSLPETERLIALGEALGVSIDALLGQAPLPHVQQEEAPIASLGRWRIVALLVMGLGLLCALVGWVMWQTPLPLGIGFAVQLCGCALYEMLALARCTPHQARPLRLAFYRLALWLLLPIPCFVIAYAAFGLYPRPYMAWVPNALAFAIYLAAGFIVRSLLTRALRR